MGYSAYMPDLIPEENLSRCGLKAKPNGNPCLDCKNNTMYCYNWEQVFTDSQGCLDCNCHA